MTSTEACRVRLEERLLNAREHAEEAKVADGKRRGLLGKPGAWSIADASDSDTISDLPVICQACGVRRSRRTCGGCRRLTCTPCRLDGRLCLACGWVVDQCMQRDQTCEEAVVQDFKAETYVSDDTGEFTLGGAWRPGWLAFCLWTVLIATVGSAIFMLSSEAQVDNDVSDSGDQICYVIFELGLEAQVNYDEFDSGDQTYDDVMFMQNVMAQVDSERFVSDAGHQVDDDKFVSDAEHQVDDDEFVSDAEHQVEDDEFVCDVECHADYDGFVRDAESETGDDQFVCDAGGQTNIGEYTLNA